MRSRIALLKSLALLSLFAAILGLASCGGMKSVLSGTANGQTSAGRHAMSTARMFSVDRSMTKFGNGTNDWKTAAPYVDYEVLSEISGTDPNKQGHSENQANAIQAAGILGLKYSDLAEVPAHSDLWNSLNGVEANWQHITAGTLGCSTSTRVVNSGVYYNPNDTVAAVASAYQTIVINDAKTNGNSAVFYDAIANFAGDNGHPPCDAATGLNWDRFAFADQVVGHFLDQMTPGNLPFFVNQNGDSDVSVPQAAVVVRAMIGHRIQAIKLETAGAMTSDLSWQSFEDDALVAAAQNPPWKTMWEYANMDDSSYPDFLARRMLGLASVMMTYYDGAGVWWSFRTTNASHTGFSVMPEVQVVPTNPVITTPLPGPNGSGNTVSAFNRGNDVFAREFNDCYVNGIDKGNCVAVVNMSNGSQSWPTLQNTYQHTLNMVGYDLAENPPGYVLCDGPPPTATIAKFTAVVACK